MANKTVAPNKVVQFNGPTKKLPVSKPATGKPLPKDFIKGPVQKEADRILEQMKRKSSNK
jgi:hypothetical protein